MPWFTAKFEDELGAGMGTAVDFTVTVPRLPGPALAADGVPATVAAVGADRSQATEVDTGDGTATASIDVSVRRRSARRTYELNVLEANTF